MTIVRVMLAESVSCGLIWWGRFELDSGENRLEEFA